MVIGCDKNEEYPFQPGYVNFTINPNSTEYINLNTVGGWEYLTATTPSRGIIVYRFSTDEFMAFERTPTYKPDSCCVFIPTAQCTKLIVDDSGIEIADTCNGSTYLILDGSVLNGPATLPLFTYHTKYDGELLHVYN